MHVSAKKLAFSGLMLAFTQILLALSGILEMNTLFFLAAASFFTGIMVNEAGMGSGAAFYTASVLLGFLLAPNKLYCLTYAAMGFYVLAAEFVYRRLGSLYDRKGKAVRGRRFLFWVCKLLLFNSMYIPALLLLPRMLFPGGIEEKWLPAALLAGQAAVVIYDLAYEYFMGTVWAKMRKKLGKL